MDNIRVKSIYRVPSFIKKVLVLGSCSVAFLVLFMGCSSDSSWDCIQTSGNIVQTEVTVPVFTKIITWERTRVFLKQGAEQKVIVETGENLLSDVEITVVNGALNIRNYNDCNYVRDYGLVKIYVTTPNITEIRSSTGYRIESIGTLKFPSLSLVSEDFEKEDQFNTSGDFKLDLEVDHLNIVANGLSKFYIRGSATKASFGLFSGDCRIYSQDLIIQDLNIYHRSTGPMVVNPQQSITGKIVSLGNVISKTRPAIVEVEELYRGRLIFE